MKKTTLQQRRKFLIANFSIMTLIFVLFISSIAAHTKNKNVTLGNNNLTGITTHSTFNSFEIREEAKETHSSSDFFNTTYPEDLNAVSTTTQTTTMEQISSNDDLIVEEIQTETTPIESIPQENGFYGTSISEDELRLLVQAVQHETGSDPAFYPNGDFDIVQQYTAASILNRIGEPGFGSGYSTPYNLYDVLSNEEQYGNITNELWNYNPYDARTQHNVELVLKGEAYIPDNLYFERCSFVGEDYYSAQDSFYNQYGYNSSISIFYMSYTEEGRYIIFATNVNGAYAY